MGAKLLSRSGFLVSIVVVPTFFAFVYYGLVASKRYVSEATFVVRNISGHRASGLAVLFQSFGISSAADDNNAIQSYLLSRDAVQALEKQLPLRRMFQHKKIDIVARFPYLWRTNSFESLFDYYLERVSVVQDRSKGLTHLKVIAFSPEDARAIASVLLKLAEEMVNRINERAQRDAIGSAQDELKSAVSRVAAAQIKMTGYRNLEHLVDPTASSASILETITNLSTELATAKAQLDQTQAAAPASPMIPALVDRVSSLNNSIEAERTKMAGGDSALAAKIADYEKIALEQKMAELALTNASAALDSARQEARRQSIYLEEVVLPNLPDESTEPQRLRMVATIFTLSLAASSVIWLILAGAKEHAIR